LLLRENGTPFYVGKGRKDRWKHHEKRCYKNNTHKDKVLRHMLDMKEKVIYIKFAENLTDDAAKHLEKELIKKMGFTYLTPLEGRTHEIRDEPRSSERRP
jgi:hypothetical protein